MNILTDIAWKEQSQEVEALLEYSDLLNVTSLESGLEAEVRKISIDGNSYVLKTWNKSSKPNVESQYKLLKVLYQQGIAVSQPLGWGTDKEANHVLLTSFDGVPVNKVKKNTFIHFAELLSTIHDFPHENYSELKLHKYDFIAYFYPDIEKHPDIHMVLTNLVGKCDLQQNKLIHGDFYLGNVLESQGKYIVIDWTNGQLGDPRYDIAWFMVLLRIYVGQRYSDYYRSLYLEQNPYTYEELELFEAIACLRWILLNRQIDLPIGKETISRVKSLVENNQYLDVTLI